MATPLHQLPRSHFGSVGQIGTTDLQDDAVTGAKIGADEIDSEHYAAGSIDNEHIADDAIDSEHYAAGSIDNSHVADDMIRPTKLNRRYTFEEFEVNPVTAAIAGGAATGTGGDENVMLFPETAFEYHILGTQDILAPSLGANGLNVGMDQTDNDGVEIGQGITARSPGAFVVGTDAAFFLSVRFRIPTVAGTDDCAVGFRKAEAYQANIDDYDELCCLNVISGNVTNETILNGGGTDTDDAVDNWADGETHTLSVLVSAAGVCTREFDGSAVSTPQAFTFDTAEVVVPFFYFLHASGVAGAVEIISWECGFQADDI